MAFSKLVSSFFMMKSCFYSAIELRSTFHQKDLGNWSKAHRIASEGFFIGCQVVELGTEMFGAGRSTRLKIKVVVCISDVARRGSKIIANAQNFKDIQIGDVIDVSGPFFLKLSEISEFVSIEFIQKVDSNNHLLKHCSTVLSAIGLAIVKRESIQNIASRVKELFETVIKKGSKRQTNLTSEVK